MKNKIHDFFLFISNTIYELQTTVDEPNGGFGGFIWRRLERFGEGRILFTLLVTFIILKLANIINWSWWWVMSPLWIGLAVQISWLIIWIIQWIMIRLFFHMLAKIERLNNWIESRFF